MRLGQGGCFKAKRGLGGKMLDGSPYSPAVMDGSMIWAVNRTRWTTLTTVVFEE
jgi:hypothetical protein